LLKKYIKWGVWRVAVCPFHIWDARFLKVKRILGLVYDNEKENWRMVSRKEIYAIVSNLP
jgi:hypothetical protein